MHVITVALRAGATFQFHYKGGLVAQPIYEEIERQRKLWTGVVAHPEPGINDSPIMTVTDDYGHAGFIDAREIGGVILADVKKEFDAKAEIQFIGAQANGELQKRLATMPGARILPAHGGLQ